MGKTDDETVCSFCGMSHLMYKEMRTKDKRIAELEKQLMFNDIHVKDAGGTAHRCRFSIPQAKAAFCAACSLPAKGMMPEELMELCARGGIDKYKQCSVMGLGPAVNGFIRNLLGEADEEQVVYEATGGTPIPRAE